MSGRNPGWTLVDIVGSAQGDQEILAAVQTDWSGTVYTGDLVLPNVQPGDLIRFNSYKNFVCDTSAGGGTDFTLSVNENNFDKRGSATYRTLYEQPNQSARHTTTGNIMLVNDHTEGLWLMQSVGSFQLSNPAEISTNGSFDSLLMRKASQFLELWRPVLPNTSGFNPAFTPMITNVVD